MAKKRRNRRPFVRTIPGQHEVECRKGCGALFTSFTLRFKHESSGCRLFDGCIEVQAAPRALGTFDPRPHLAWVRNNR